MSARSTMKHRATVQRDGASGTDDYNQSVKPTWQSHLTALPCYYWTQSKRVTNAQNEQMTVMEAKMIVPKDTDITDQDRITQVADRQGNVIYGQTTKIDAVIPRKDHLALTLQAVE